MSFSLGAEEGNLLKWHAFDVQTSFKGVKPSIFMSLKQIKKHNIYFCSHL